MASGFDQASESAAKSWYVRCWRRIKSKLPDGGTRKPSHGCVLLSRLDTKPGVLSCVVRQVHCHM